MLFAFIGIGNIGLVTKMGRNSGYTIVEMMIVVTIIAIGSALAATSIIRARKNTLLTDASRETYNILQTARSTALLRNVAVGISIRKDTVASFIRLDESTSTSCSDIAGAADSLRYGFMGLSFGESRWNRFGGARVAMESLRIGGEEVATASLCVNRTGRLLRFAGGGWNVIGTWPALEIRYQLYDEGGPVGVERVVRMEQGGIVRIVR